MFVFSRTFIQSSNENFSLKLLNTFFLEFLNFFLGLLQEFPECFAENALEIATAILTTIFFFDIAPAVSLQIPSGSPVEISEGIVSQGFVQKFFQKWLIQLLVDF